MSNAFGHRFEFVYRVRRIKKDEMFEKCRAKGKTERVLRKYFKGDAKDMNILTCAFPTNLNICKEVHFLEVPNHHGHITKRWKKRVPVRCIATMLFLTSIHYQDTKTSTIGTIGITVKEKR